MVSALRFAALFSCAICSRCPPKHRTAHRGVSVRKRGMSKDARGNEVHQVVNAADGTLTSVTDSNGQTVNYTYDESKRVTGVETTADGKAYRNAYTYENDRIKTVAHNTTGDTPDVTYTFNYDELGRKITVKVGSQTPSPNVYTAERSGLLSEMQYGNDATTPLSVMNA